MEKREISAKSHNLKDTHHLHNPRRMPYQLAVSARLCSGQFQGASSGLARIVA